MKELVLKDKITQFFIFHLSLFTKNYNLAGKLQKTELLHRYNGLRFTGTQSFTGILLPVILDCSPEGVRG